jgi:AcrR family transcriptional regulator
MNRRGYRLGKRAESQQETRRRITEATVELHGTVGASQTTIADIARKAGVQRLTVYTHFPDLTSLFNACTTHWAAQHPMPDAREWLAVREPLERLSRALVAMYAYYDDNQAMFTNWLRDAEIIPELKPFAEAGYYHCIADIRDATLIDLALPEDARAAFHVALSFDTWRLLHDREGLSNAAAANLMARTVLSLADSVELTPEP